MVQRLKWVKEKQRFAAYPVGFGPHHGCAAVWPNSGRHGTWVWSVIWEDWFSENGIGESKQEAADAATAAWWKLVATPIPRDVESEIAVLVARAPVMPPPNHLLTEDRDYLVRLNRALALQYAVELRGDQLPGPIKNLMESLSAELYRRRVSTGVDCSIAPIAQYEAGERDD